MATTNKNESTASAGKVEIPLSEANRPWLRPLTHTARTVIMPNEKCHKTIEESLMDTQRHAGFGGDSGELDDSHPDAGHEALEKPAQEAAEKAFRKAEATEHKGEY